LNCPASGGGCPLTRFEDNRISRQKRRHKMSVSDMRREIIRPKNSHHSMRAKSRPRYSLSRRPAFISATPPIRLGRNLDLGHHGSNFRSRLPKRLAHLQRNQPGQLLPVLLNAGRKRPRNPQPPLKPPVPPRPKCDTGG